VCLPGPHCFVLLVPTPEEYRVPRVNPGVTASKLFPPLLPSLATPGPPLPYRLLQKARYYYPVIRGSEWGPASAWPHQWVAPRKQGGPHFVLGG